MGPRQAAVNQLAENPFNRLGRRQTYGRDACASQGPSRDGQYKPGSYHGNEMHELFAADV